MVNMLLITLINSNNTSFKLDIMGTYIMYGIGALITALLLFLVYKMYTSYKKTGQLQLSEMLAHNAKDKIEIIATISNVGEIFTLAYIAEQRMPGGFTSGLFRYILVGTLELMFTFIFMQMAITWIRSIWTGYYEKGIGSALKSGAINLIPTSFIFIVSCIPTLMLVWLYLESIGLLKLVFTFNILNPFDMFRVLPIKYTAANMPVPELGALLTIAFNPVLNIFLMFLLFPQLKKEVQAEVAKTKTEKEKKEKKGTKKEELKDFMSRVQAILKNQADGMSGNVIKLLDPKHADCHPAIKDGSKTEDEIIDSWLRSCMGSADPKAPSNLLGLEYLRDEIARVEEDSKSVNTNIARLEEDVKNATGTHKDDLATQLADEKRKKAELERKKSKLPSDFEGQKNILAGQLKTLKLIN